MTITEKIVDFYKNCKKCEHHDVPEAEEPCNSCLNEPFNENTTVPINFKSKEN